MLVHDWLGFHRDDGFWGWWAVTQRKHTSNGMLSPVDFEERQHELKKSGV